MPIAHLLSSVGDAVGFAEVKNDTDAMCDGEPAEAPFAAVSRYLIPVLVFIGIIGNSLILIVLNSRKKMKTKTNLLLSFMASSDLVHAIGTFFYHLQLYQAYVDFRHIYPNIQIPMLTVMRFSGMASNWFGVAVTVERLMAIRNPLAMITRKRSIVRLALVIFMSSMAVCSQPLACWRGGSDVLCNEQVVYFYDQPSDESWHSSCLIWEQVSAFCYIIIPVVFMFVCNAALIYYMQRHSMSLVRFDSCRLEIRRKSIPYNGIAKSGYGALHADSSEDRKVRPVPSRNRRVSARPKKEMQAAVVVLALSLTSACMALPSAVGANYYFVAWMMDALPEDETRSWYAPYVQISNLLFLAEKNLAVFIYCITSARFRRRLWSVLRCKKDRSEKTPLSTKLMLVPLTTTATANLRPVMQAL